MKQGRARSLETLAILLIAWTALRVGVTLNASGLNDHPSQVTAPERRPPTRTVGREHNPLPLLMASVATGSAGRHDKLWRAPPAPVRMSSGKASSVTPIATQNINAPLSETAESGSAAEGPHPARIAIDSPDDGNAHARTISGAAWVLWRPAGAGRQLGTGGQLGGSQAGVRVLLPVALRGKLRASLRAAVPLASPGAYDISPGISIKPFHGMALEVIAERRLRAGPGDHDATSIFATGGFAARLGSGLQLEGYAQAGGVGMRQTMWFADGSASVRRAVNATVDVGGGVWSGIQPGAKRIDIGPSATIRLPIGRGDLRLMADWRFRIAGNAKPLSGPAITLGSNF